MLREEFRRWAEHGCRIYGEDPWYFLRELAQNSRDAGSSLIRVKAYINEHGRELLEFEDNGAGMTLEHARRYLFRLYASSKEDDRRSAGKYGIGFWSVLKYSPTHILVESRTRGGGWGIILDETFELAGVRCTLKHRGTRVTLVRRPRTAAEEAFREEVEKAIKRYCRYLRRNNWRSTKLPILFYGKNLTRTMRLPGPVSLSFRDGPVEGAVSFAESPRISLYARGLPVWKGTLLDELYHTAVGPADRGEIASGLAPVFLLNGNNLNVIMSRQAVIDDRALARVRKSARRALARLVRMHMEHAFPRSGARKALDAVTGGWERLAGVPPVYLILSVLIAVLAGLIINILPGAVGTRGGGTAARKISVIPSTYGGAVVEDLDGPPGVEVDLAYDPAVEAWFKILSAEDYDVLRGFVARKLDKILAPALDFKCSKNCISVRLRVDAGGRTALPVPSGYGVDTGSVRFNKAPVKNLRQSPGGDVVAELPARKGIVEYRCGPLPASAAADQALLRKLTQLPPDLPIPQDIELLLNQVSGRSVESKLITALTLTRMLITYDDSAETGKVYRRIVEANGWLPFVLGVGKGDCDVLNGLNTLLLRAMDVPARLAVGLIGRGGRATSTMHAWTEYYDGGWHSVDASPVPEPPPQTGSKQQTAVGEEVEKPPAAVEAVQAPVPPRIILVPAERWSEEDEKFLERALQQPPMNMKAEPAAARSWAMEDRTSFGLLLLLLLCGGLALVFSAFLFMRGGDWEHMEKVKDPRVAEEILAKIVSSASVQPRIWRHARQLWIHRILPAIGEKRISLKKASKLARGRRLFIGSQSNPLAVEAAEAGSVVLDREHELFGSFISRLSGVVDLDAVAALSPCAPPPESLLTPLLENVGRVLARTEAKGVPCLDAPGLTSSDMRDVDLTTLSLHRSTDWPRRFIAVNPSGPFVQECMSLLPSNPHLAAFNFIMKATRESLLLRACAGKVRLAAAKILVEEAAS